MIETINEKYLTITSNNKEIMLYGLDDLFYFIRNSNSFNDTNIFTLIQSGKVTSWITQFNKIIADELIKFESIPKKYLFFAYLYCRRYCYKNSNLSLNDIIGYDDIKEELSKINSETKFISFSGQMGVSPFDVGRDNYIFSEAFLNNSQSILIDSDFYYLSYFFNDIYDKKNIFQKLDFLPEELENEDFKTKSPILFLFTPLISLKYKRKEVEKINYLNTSYDLLIMKLMNIQNIPYSTKISDYTNYVCIYDNQPISEENLYIRTPNYEERVAYFKKYLSKFHTNLFCGYLPVISLSENIDYEELAKKTEFYSIKDIELICYNSLTEILNKINSGDKEAKVTQEVILSKFFETTNFIWFEKQILILKRRKGPIINYLEKIRYFKWGPINKNYLEEIIRYFEWKNASILNQSNCPEYIILDWDFLKSLRNVNKVNKK